jgi:hypothetical protein
MTLEWVSKSAPMLLDRDGTFMALMCHHNVFAVDKHLLLSHADACRLMDARGELALLALLRPEGAAGVLDLSACGFDALPSIVWDLPGRAMALQELNLTNNRLRTLPEVSKCTLDNSWGT